MRDYIIEDPRNFVKSPTYKEWYEKNHLFPTIRTVTYQELVPLEGESNEDIRDQHAEYPYTYTSERFEGHIRTAKKQKTVSYTEAILNQLKLKKETIKRTPTWIFDSAFDTMLNPFLHVSIYYFLISDWSERK
jgi:hypothetical protein